MTNRPITSSIIRAGLIIFVSASTIGYANDPDLITPASATSASAFSGRVISRTIDGSALSGLGLTSDVPSETHAVNSGTTGYWLSDTVAAGTEWMQFSLSTPHNVDGIHQWLYTRGGETDRGLRTFDIHFSVDNGATFPVTINAATLGDFTQPGASALPAQTKGFTMQKGVTDIRIDNLVNFGDGIYQGLSEIRFRGIPTPNSGIIFMVR